MVPRGKQGVVQLGVEVEYHEGGGAEHREDDRQDVVAQHHQHRRDQQLAVGALLLFRCNKNRNRVGVVRAVRAQPLAKAAAGAAHHAQRLR